MFTLTTSIDNYHVIWHAFLGQQGSIILLQNLWILFISYTSSNKKAITLLIQYIKVRK